MLSGFKFEEEEEEEEGGGAMYSLYSALTVGGGIYEEVVLGS